MPKKIQNRTLPKGTAVYVYIEPDGVQAQQHTLTLLPVYRDTRYLVHSSMSSGDPAGRTSFSLVPDETNPTRLVSPKPSGGLAASGITPLRGVAQDRRFIPVADLATLGPTETRARGGRRREERGDS